LIAETRRLAAEFRRSTGQSLPVSGEIARHDAARLLDLDLCEPRTGGVDAIGKGDLAGQRFQIKSRVITQEKKSGSRIGQLNLNGDWDKVLLVIMDDEYEPCEIYCAGREDIAQAVDDSGSSTRTRRGALSVSKLRIISELVWTREHGREEELWTNR
jgi:hypothetical protein